MVLHTTMQLLHSSLRYETAFLLCIVLHSVTVLRCLYVGDASSRTSVVRIPPILTTESTLES